MVSIVKSIVDFALFKEFVTPAFLKVLYLIFFIVMNVGGLIMIGIYLVLGVLAFVASLGKDMTSGIITLVVMLIMVVILIIMLILYNLFFRMYFEVVLLMFNIHGYLKSIDDKTSAGRK